MRSPTIPRFARSFKSEVAIKRPSGILPGAKVFQLPPPAVEARAIPESAGAGCAGADTGEGNAATAGCTGIGDAAATTIGALVAAAGGGGGGVATVTAAGVAAAGTGCRATTGASVGTTEGAGVALVFWFLASFPPLDDAVGF